MNLSTKDGLKILVSLLSCSCNKQLPNNREELSQYIWGFDVWRNAEHRLNLPPDTFYKITSDEASIGGKPALDWLIDKAFPTKPLEDLL